MTEQTDSQPVPAAVQCPAAKDPAVRRFILAAMLLGFGAWCFHDAIKGKYPWKEGMGLNDASSYYLTNVGQYVLPAAGLIPLVLGIMVLRRKLTADQEGIGFVGKVKVPWEKVGSLDTSDLANKGILRLRYDLGEGRQTLVLDSYRLQNFRELVKLVENKVPPPTAS